MPVAWVGQTEASEDAYVIPEGALDNCSAKGVVQDAIRDLELIRAAGIEGLEPVFELLQSALEDEAERAGRRMAVPEAAADWIAGQGPRNGFGVVDFSVEDCAVRALPHHPGAGGPGPNCRRLAGARRAEQTTRDRGPSGLRPGRQRAPALPPAPTRPRPAPGRLPARGANR